MTIPRLHSLGLCLLISTSAWPQSSRPVTRQEVESSIAKVETLARELPQLRQKYVSQMRSLREKWDQADDGVVWEDPEKRLRTDMFAARTAAVGMLYDPNPLQILAELKKRRAQVDETIREAWHVKALAGTIALGGHDELTAKEYQAYTHRLQAAAQAAEHESARASTVFPPDLPTGQRILVGVTREGFNLDMNVFGLQIGNPLGNVTAMTLLTRLGCEPNSTREVFLEEGLFERRSKGLPVQVYWTRRKVVVDMATGVHLVWKEYDFQRFNGERLVDVYLKTGQQCDFESSL